MDQPHRSTVRYAATWRVVGELLRRHQAGHDLRLTWYFPGMSADGVAELQRADGTAVLRLDVAHGEHGVAALSSRRTGGVDVRWYVSALLAADQPATVIDALERAAGLTATGAPPASTPPARCADVLATALTGRMLAVAPYRTTPAVLDHGGHVRTAAWAAAVPGADPRHLIALHRGPAILDRADGAFAVADLRAGVVHVIDAASATDPPAAHPSFDTRAALGPLRDWLDRSLPP